MSPPPGWRACVATASLKLYGRGSGWIRNAFGAQRYRAYWYTTASTWPKAAHRIPSVKPTGLGHPPHRSSAQRAASTPSAGISTLAERMAAKVAVAISGTSSCAVRIVKRSSKRGRLALNFPEFWLLAIMYRSILGYFGPPRFNGKIQVF